MALAIFESLGSSAFSQRKSFRSLRAIGQRYRIVYRVDPTALQVVIYGIGLRKDGDRDGIYERMRRASHPRVVAVAAEPETKG
jgi:mRNA interferase RelE/StbE